MWRLPSVARDTSSASRCSGSAAARSPLACNSLPKLQMELSVSGCRLPSVSRDTSNASRNSGSASPYLPWFCSSEASVPRVKFVASPSVRSAWSRALRSSRLSAS
eukprot:scaffold133458_cov96-Phaeocystis_antarctica.AAC.1